MCSTTRGWSQEGEREGKVVSGNVWRVEVLCNFCVGWLKWANSDKLGAIAQMREVVSLQLSTALPEVPIFIANEHVSNCFHFPFVFLLKNSI